MIDELTNVITEIRSDIQIINEDAGLREKANFINRAEAIDFLDFHIIDRIEGLLQKKGRSESLDALKEQARQIKLGLEKTDESLFKCLREEISASPSNKSVLKEIISRYLKYPNDCSGKIGYDHLDTFLNGLLSDQPAPEAVLERTPGMVFYQKTPATIIFEMAERAKLNQDDVFFDLGSGLGQVVILVHLLTGAAARGLEYEPVYCRYAQICASQLNLSDVQFFNTDARNGDYSLGTVFFMYTPFEGSMLEEMLEILRKEAEKRVIRIFTYGPCTFSVAQQDWLHCKDDTIDDCYELYEFTNQAP